MELDNYKLQKFFRGKKALELARSEIRKNFCSTFGEHCERIDWYALLNPKDTSYPFHCQALWLPCYWNRSSFGTDSDFLSQFLFFFNANEDNDIALLCQVCNLLLEYVKNGGKFITLF